MSERNNSCGCDDGSHATSSPVSGCRCPHCWCVKHLQTHQSLWTAEQAAKDCGCTVAQIAYQMSHVFRFESKYVGDVKRRIYNVNPDARFRGLRFAELTNKMLIWFWQRHELSRLMRIAYADKEVPPGMKQRLVRLAAQYDL